MTRQTDGSSSERARREAQAKGQATDAGSSAERGAISNQPSPLLLGHRGARPVSRRRLDARRATVPPENTLAVFEYALAQRCDGFEFDIRLTRDERLVLCHDPRLGGRNVATSSYDSLCSGLHEAIPRLEDVLTAFSDRGYLDIEVKVQAGEELIVEALRKNKPQRYLLSSFLPEVLRRFHQLDPTLPLGYICDRPEEVRTWQNLPTQVFLPQYELVSEKLIREVHSRGLQIFTWTVNRQADMRRLAAWGIDGLISDDPALLAQTCRIPKAPVAANSE